MHLNTEQIMSLIPLLKQRPTTQQKSPYEMKILKKTSYKPDTTSMTEHNIPPIVSSDARYASKHARKIYLRLQSMQRQAHMKRQSKTQEYPKICRTHLMPHQY